MHGKPPGPQCVVQRLCTEMAVEAGDGAGPALRTLDRLEDPLLSLLPSNARVKRDWVRVALVDPPR